MFLLKIFCRIKFHILITLISLLPLISIFSTSNLFHSHDGLVHLARIAAYYKSLNDFQVPVRWVGDLNYGYGMPLFNFIYQVPYFLSSVFIFLGFDLVNSFKIVLSLSFIFSGIFMFAFSNAFFKDTKKAFLATLFYQFAPFRLVEVLVRGSFGEVYTYTFFPLVLFGLILLFRKPKYLNFLLTAIAAALLVLSHNALSLVFFTITGFFIVAFSKTKKNALIGFFSLLIGLMMSSFYWVPAILDHKYTYGDLFMKNIYLSHFPPIQNFFIPNFTNSPAFWTGGISVQFGFFHVIAVLLAVIFLFKNKENKALRKINLFGLILLIISLFFMQPVSKIFWEKISLLRQFQFPWRLLALSSFATAILSVNFFSIKLLNKKFPFLVLVFLVIVSTVFYWKPSLGYDKIDQKYYWNFPLNTTYFGETDLIWSEGPAKSYPKNKVDVIAGKARIGDYIKKTQTHSYSVNASVDSVLVDHTQYFPGWRVFVNNREVPIQFQDQNWRGQITFPISKGENSIKVIFGETKTRLLVDIISLTTFVILLLLFPIIKLKKNEKK